MKLNELYKDFLDINDLSDKDKKYLCIYLAKFDKNKDAKEIFQETRLITFNMQRVLNINENYNEKPDILRLLKDFNTFVCINEDLPYDNLYGNHRFYKSGELPERILKYLQDGYKPLDTIAKYFSVNLSTVKDCIRDMELGNYKVFDRVNVKLDRNNNGEYSYSVHPTCYALNLTETVAMTIGLKELAKGTKYEAVLNDVADETYWQISDYAKGYVDDLAKEKNIKFDSLPTSYKKELDKIINNPRYLDAFYSKRPHCNKLIEFKLKSGENIVGTVLDYFSVQDKISCFTVLSNNKEEKIYVKDILSINALN